MKNNRQCYFYCPKKIKKNLFVNSCLEFENYIHDK